MKPCHEGVTTDEQRRLKKLDRENRELRRANEILICRLLQIPRRPTTPPRPDSRAPRRFATPTARSTSVGVRDNLQVHGARKVWRQLRREDLVVARCTAAQLMREMGVAGVVRGTPNRTTTGEETAGPH